MITNLFASDIWCDFCFCAGSLFLLAAIAALLRAGTKIKRSK